MTTPKRFGNFTAHPTLPGGRRLLGLWVAVCLVAACASTPLPQEALKGQSQLSFVDLQGFDRDLASSLGVPLPTVDIVFYDRVAPSALPERLQKWLAAVEDGGGKVKVTQPKSTVTAKSPFLLLGAITSLWTASKMMLAVSADSRYKAARGYDAEMLLKLDDKGDTVLDKVVLIRRQP